MLVWCLLALGKLYEVLQSEPPESAHAAALRVRLQRQITTGLAIIRQRFGCCELVLK